MLLGNTDKLFIKLEYTFEMLKFPRMWVWRAVTTCSLITIQGDKENSRQPFVLLAYRDAFGFQDEAGDVPGGERQADGVLDAPHQAAAEGVAGGHLQEQDHPLLAVLVVLRDAQAVGHLLKGFHCKWESSLALGLMDRCGHEVFGVVSKKKPKSPPPLHRQTDPAWGILHWASPLLALKF